MNNNSDKIITTSKKALRKTKSIYLFGFSMFVFGIIMICIGMYTGIDWNSADAFIISGLMGFMLAMAYVTGSVLIGLKPIILYDGTLHISKHRIINYLTFKSQVVVAVSSIKTTSLNKHKIPGYKNAYNELLVINTIDSEYRIESVVFGPLSELHEAIDARLKEVIRDT